MLLEASASRSATDLCCQDPQLAEVLQNVRACADLGGLDVEDVGVTRQFVGKNAACVVMPKRAANATLMSGRCGLQ